MAGAGGYLLGHLGSPQCTPQSCLARTWILGEPGPDLEGTRRGPRGRLSCLPTPAALASAWPGGPRTSQLLRTAVFCRPGLRGPSTPLSALTPRAGLGHQGRVTKMPGLGVRTAAGVSTQVSASAALGAGALANRLPEEETRPEARRRPPGSEGNTPGVAWPPSPPALASAPPPPALHVSYASRVRARVWTHVHAPTCATWEPRSVRTGGEDVPAR